MRAAVILLLAGMCAAPPTPTAPPMPALSTVHRVAAPLYAAAASVDPITCYISCADETGFPLTIHIDAGLSVRDNTIAVVTIDGHKDRMCTLSGHRCDVGVRVPINAATGAYSIAYCIRAASEAPCKPYMWFGGANMKVGR